MDHLQNEVLHANAGEALDCLTKQYWSSEDASLDELQTQ